jgi:hypothetical protein
MRSISFGYRGRDTAIFVVGALLTFGAAFGHGEIPGNVPVARVVANLEAYIKEHPNDADARYRLGRFHAMAFELKSNQVTAYERENQLPRPATRGFMTFAQSVEKGGPPRNEGGVASAFARGDQELERRGSTWNARPARFHLALASALESGVELAGEIDAHPLIPTRPRPTEEARWLVEDAKKLNPFKVTDQLRSRYVRDGMAQALYERYQDKNDADRAKVKELLVVDWKEQITEQYFEAMALGLPEDSKLEALPMWGQLLDWVTYEAATRYLDIVKTRGPRADEQVRMAVATATKKAFDSLPPPQGITPIVFSLDGVSTLTPLLSPSTCTAFDLEGSGRPQRWRWSRQLPAFSCGIRNEAE